MSTTDSVAYAQRDALGMRGQLVGADVAISIYDKLLRAVKLGTDQPAWLARLAALTLKGSHPRERPH